MNNGWRGDRCEKMPIFCLAVHSPTINLHFHKSTFSPISSNTLNGSEKHVHSLIIGFRLVANSSFTSKTIQKYHQSTKNPTNHPPPTTSFPFPPKMSPTQKTDQAPIRRVMSAHFSGPRGPKRRIGLLSARKPKRAEVMMMKIFILFPKA